MYFYILGLVLDENNAYISSKERMPPNFCGNPHPLDPCGRVLKVPVAQEVDCPPRGVWVGASHRHLSGLLAGVPTLRIQVL